MSSFQAGDTQAAAQETWKLSLGGLAAKATVVARTTAAGKGWWLGYRF
jgi:hypothetical protein